MMTTFRLLARLGPAGTRLDLLVTRRNAIERSPIGEYTAAIDSCCPASFANRAVAVEIAGVATRMRGFGHVGKRTSLWRGATSATLDAVRPGAGQLLVSSSRLRSIE
jgi:hypothetical protein